MDDFEIVDAIAEGGYGCVFLATSEKYEDPVALKFIILYDKEDYEMTRKEFIIGQEIYKTCQPFAIKYLDLSVHSNGRRISPKYQTIFLEKCPRMYENLKTMCFQVDYMVVVMEIAANPRKLIPVSELLFGLLYTLAEANKRLGFIHNDLKLGNIVAKPYTDRIELLEFSYIPSTGYIPAMIDFGFSSTNNYPPELDGTYIYLPPEVLVKYGPKKTIAADVWVLGCILLESIYPKFVILLNKIELSKPMGAISDNPDNDRLFYRWISVIALLTDYEVTMNTLTVLGFDIMQLPTSSSFLFFGGSMIIEEEVKAMTYSVIDQISPLTRDLLAKLLSLDPKVRQDIDKLLKHDGFTHLRRKRPAIQRCIQCGKTPSFLEKGPNNRLFCSVVCQKRNFISE